MSPLSVVCVPSRRITRFTQILFNVKRRINHIKTNQIIVTNDNINFWNKATNDITWFKQPTVTFSSAESLPFSQWYPDGILNICYNALDKHMNNDQKDRIALIYDSPVTNTIIKYTYQELLIIVCEVTAVLNDLGVSKGDKVLIYM